MGFVTLNVCLIALALGGRWSGSDIAMIDDSPLSVRLLQPNFEIMMDWDRERVDQNYDELFSMSQSACDQSGALVVWPESAGWPYSFGGDEFFRHGIEQFSRESCPVLLNSSTTTELGDHNSVLLVTASGLEDQYDKHLLVPFGEYVPMSEWVPFLNQIARHAGAFSAGTEISPLVWRDQELGVAICYEITFPEEVARQVRLGSSILVTVTNDAWYGDSWAPWQHFYAARFRAAESRRYLVRAALTGVSAIVAPDGSVEQLLGVGERGILAADIPGTRGRTLYTSLPWIVPVFSFIIMGSAIFVTRQESRS
jgi:apolipoprotein N-acyltransferase